MFSNDSHYYVPEEVPKAGEYILAEQQRRQLEIKPVFAKKGDMVIWHEHLPHSGQPPKDRSRTRRSLVGHFFGKTGLEKRTLRVSSNSMYFQYNPVALLPDS